MFKEVLDNHSVRQQKLEGLAESETRKGVGQASRAAELLVDEVNADVLEIYETQKKIEHESKLLKLEVKKAVQNVQNWLVVIEQLRGAVKDLGDYENYLLAISNQVSSLSQALSRSIEAEETSQPSSSTAGS